MTQPAKSSTSLAPAPSGKELTIGQLVEHLAPDVARRKSPPPWPPDAFALAASLLLQSGAYLQSVASWPPAGGPEDACLPVTSAGWAEQMCRIGDRWRQGWPDRSVPKPVRDWWRILRKHWTTPLSKVGETRGLCCALLQICATADEASAGVGIPYSGQFDWFNFHAEHRLVPASDLGSTLGFEVHPSRARVLPKCHTPQRGITLNSITHHLALWPSSDVCPYWYTALPRNRQDLMDWHSLNLLLVPWPLKIRPTKFGTSRPPGGLLANMPESFGFFTYESGVEADLKTGLENLYRRASELSGRVDMVVFPELAVNPSQYALLREWAAEKQVLLVCGVGELPPKGAEGEPGKNYVALEVPFSATRSIQFLQNKHHRWCLDKDQIVQYNLGAQLNPERSWWEHMSAEARKLTFVSVAPWLSFCVLVCEDLARQEPVARLVRSVGPNLVIALLMDGPQFEFRWPGRYAGVLAEDPGSSVLTLTSLGMAEMSRPPGKPLSRIVALWKDAKSGAREIELPQGAEGLLLTLVRRFEEEWTADGRSDGRAAGYPILGGIHPVSMEA